jgi:hypothetical protein
MESRQEKYKVNTINVKMFSPDIGIYVPEVALQYTAVFVLSL